MKKIRTASIVLIVLYALAHIIFLRGYPTTNIGYQLWKLGLAPQMNSYTKLALKDDNYLASFKGKPIGDLLKVFPNLDDGLDYPTNSYRGRIRDRQLKFGGYTYYWFDSHPNKFGWSAKVKDGLVDRIILVKGQRRFENLIEQGAAPDTTVPV